MDKCIFCGDELNEHNVFMYKERKDIVDKCDSCCDKLEKGYDMYP